MPELKPIEIRLFIMVSIPRRVPMVTWYVVVLDLKTTGILLPFGIESPLSSSEPEHYKI